MMWLRLALILILIQTSLPVYADMAAVYVDPAKMPAISASPAKDSIESTTSIVSIKKKDDYTRFLGWVNGKNYYVQVDTRSEKQKTRDQWERALGVDVFYPYFELRKLKIKTENKTKIKIFNLHGKAKLKKDEVKFTFKLKF